MKKSVTFSAKIAFSVPPNYILIINILFTW